MPEIASITTCTGGGSRTTTNVGGRTTLATTSMSRPSSSSTAGTAPSGSSAPPQDHPSGSAPMPRYPASAHGGVRPVASARPGSGRSRFAGRRRRTRPELPLWRRRSGRMARSNTHPHLAVEKLWKTSVVDPQTHAGLRAGGPATLRRSGRSAVTRMGYVRKKPRKERELLPTLPKRLSPSRRSYGAAVCVGR